MNELLRDSAAAAGLALASSDGLRFRMACDVQEDVLLDRDQMMRVVANLLTNAREALGGSGQIDLEATEGRGPDGRAWVRIAVRDTGRGMSEDFIRTSLFRPFTSTKSAGLGIGLVQCRGIVEAHGGTITVDSRPGHGTTFTVVIPEPDPRAKAKAS
jgi:hypothetical protein